MCVYLKLFVFIFKGDCIGGLDICSLCHQNLYQLTSRDIHASWVKVHICVCECSIIGPFSYFVYMLFPYMRVLTESTTEVALSEYFGWKGKKK